jgi:hypothetical protein
LGFKGITLCFYCFPAGPSPEASCQEMVLWITKKVADSLCMSLCFSWLLDHDNSLVYLRLELNYSTRFTSTEIN